MKYKHHIYAKALTEAVMAPGAKGDVIAKNFMELLERNNDTASARKILEEAARMARGRGGIRKVTVNSARALTKKQRAAIGGFLGPTDVVEERIVPDLIAGIRIFVDDEELYDGSLKGKLDLMFK